MIKMFELASDNCKTCYKCIRHCPVKAIRFESGKAVIDMDKCIACGQCFVVCPKHVRNADNDYANISGRLERGERMAALVDSAYLAMFDEPERFVAGLRRLGFATIQETAAAAFKVADEQMKYIDEHKDQKYMITASCPSEYLYVGKYYPELVQYLIPVVSPSCALAKHVKRDDPDMYTVYIGQCLSRRHESAFTTETGLDAAISFAEAIRLMKVRFIDYTKLEPEMPDVIAENEKQSYAMPGEMCDILAVKAESLGYSVVTLDGTDKTKEMLDAMKDGILDRTLADMGICHGSCLNGPFMHGNREMTNMFLSLQKLRKHVEERKRVMGIAYLEDEMNWDGIDLSVKFDEKAIVSNKYSEKQIKEVLKKMGKNTRADELDCGACGYDSCRKKAIAVLDGMVQEDMCMPYMKKKAESMTSAIFTAARNSIIMTDLGYKIVRINPAFEKIIKMKSSEVAGHPISEFIAERYFRNAVETKTDTVGKKIFIDRFGYAGLMNVIYMEDEGLVMATIQDTSEAEKRRTELEKLRLNTVDVAQNVIDRQMMVAQEIASLLGETTAETKVALNKLKKVVLEEGE